MKRNVLVFGALSIFASALNYITYPVMARILPASQYIDITVSLSLLTQMSTFLSSIVAITIGLSKDPNAQKSEAQINALQAALFKLFVTLGLLFVVISPAVLPHFHIPLPFILPIFFMMIVSLPIAVISGYLNGKAKLVKLGLLAAISAVLQIVVTIMVAVATKSGLWAMFAMGTGQLITIPLIYGLFRSENLPGINTAAANKITPAQPYAKRLLAYTLFASLAIMAINLLQIADLLVVQAQHLHNVTFYTNIYVISRVVFFGGMVVIWPFLAEINIEQHHLNRKPLYVILAEFCLIALAAITAVAIFGNLIARELFGAHYSLASVRQIGILSILYKIFFLIITAVTLYFIVLRSYWAVSLAIVATLGISAVTLFMPTGASLHQVLLRLDAVAGILTLLSLALFMWYRPNQQKS